jgi:thiol-disulfide isomerase/thioredoxin
MRRIVLLSALLFSFISFSQITVTVTGNIFNTNEDTIKISQFFGTHYKDILAAPIAKKGHHFVKNSKGHYRLKAKKGNFTLTGTIANPDYYVLRLGDTHINLILRDKSTITVYADGSNIQAYATINGSVESANMNEFIKSLSAWNQKQDTARLMMQQHPEQTQIINNSMQVEYSNFQSKKQNFLKENTNSAALIAALSVVDPEKEFPAYESIINQMMASFKESPTVQQINGNLIQFKAQKEAANFLAPGKLATDFEDTKPDGTKMKLSDLKGKVVLLDFWASWCGPCRKENPNVVKLYEKYNKEGFTVMSVSMDQDRSKWLAAIEKDQLAWPNHVCDLKGWACEAGKAYQVTSIPFTVLIDQEGKIVKTNLRGDALEQELLRIFGH